MPISKISPQIAGSFQPGDIVRAKKYTNGSHYVILGHSPAWGGGGGSYITIRKKYFDAGKFENSYEDCFHIDGYEVVGRIDG